MCRAIEACCRSESLRLSRYVINRCYGLPSFDTGACLAPCISRLPRDAGRRSLPIAILSWRCHSDLAGEAQSVHELTIARQACLCFADRRRKGAAYTPGDGLSESGKFVAGASLL